MKLTVALTLLCLIHVTASVYPQSNKFSLDIRNKQILDILKEIESQSDYRFFYQDEQVDVNRKVNINLLNKNFDQIIHDLFIDQNISYKIFDNGVVLLTKNNIKSTSNQTLTVKGKVIDINGNSLPGVNVVEKGTTNGAITNLDGEYIISVTSSEAILSFSYIGFLNEEIEINGQTTIDITLVEDIKSLEEVVVIGYGKMKKADITGAVGAVQGDDIANRQSAKLSQALQGTVSGVMVTRSGNAPGSSATIRIRGITTISDNNPLIIVDGIPVNSIDDINPNDIESLSILKDAASASIYGARAAAGVILITTKRAQSGELNIDYNFEYGLEKPTVSPKYANAVRYMKMVNELQWNDNGNGTDEYPIYTQDIVDNYATLNSENPDLYPDTDWDALIFNKTSPRQSHVLSISAGTNNIRTKASLAYDKIDALYDGRTYERITARFNNDMTINKYLSATLDLYAKRTIEDQPVVDPIEKTRMTAPVYAAIWSEGRVANGKAGENIYGQMKYGGSNDSRYNQIGGKIALHFKPFEGFEISGVASPNLDFNKGKIFRKQIATYAWNDPSLFDGYLKNASSTSLTESRDDDYQITTQVIASYDKSISSHNFNIMTGFENYYAYYEGMEGYSDQLELSNFPYLGLANDNYVDVDGDAYENAYRSWFGRIMYNYQNKYFIQGNIRYDGSSRFASEYRWGAFPSFSAGWVLSEEAFMQNFEALSFLKLRASWGTLGNERIGNYPYQSTMAFESALFYESGSVTSSQTAAQRYYAIRDISWETTESYDIGFDIGFFDNKLLVSGDYYEKTTKDMLLALEIPDYMGFDNPDQNTGKMDTKGWETEIGWNDNMGELKYSLSFNISDFKSTMGDLGGTEFIGDQIKIQGSEYNEWYGYVSDGLYQTQDDVDNLPKLNSSVSTGDVKYTDISGPDGVPDGIISPEYDRVLLGGSLPRYIYGGNIKLFYKGFDFSIVLQGVGKQNVRLEEKMVRPFMEQWLNMPLLIDGKYWSHYNTEGQNLNAKYPRFSKTSSENNYALSDHWLFNGSYFRLKNITLGYTIPDKFTQKVGVNNCRIYSSVSDLFTINNYPDGWDPENSSTGYPITTSFVFGISIKF